MISDESQYNQEFASLILLLFPTLPYLSVFNFGRSIVWFGVERKNHSLHMWHFICIENGVRWDTDRSGRILTPRESQLEVSTRDWLTQGQSMNVLNFTKLTSNHLCLSPEYRGPLDVLDHSAHCALPLPVHLHPRLHRIRLQADASPVLTANMGLSGHHGLPLHVLWRETQPLGPGRSFSLFSVFGLISKSSADGF